MELGSEFNLALNELSVCSNHLFDYMNSFDFQLYDSGRSAIKQIPFLKNKKVLLPEFICESVRMCFSTNQIEFYQITEDFQINLDDLKNKITADVGTIYIVHYFGGTQNSELLRQIRSIANNFNIIIIEDTTQSLFSKHEIIGDYLVASVRKWFPIPLGGILYCPKKGKLPPIDNIQKSTDNNRLYAMVLKDMFLKTGYECNEKYRSMFYECETRLDAQNEVFLMSDFSKFILSCMNIDGMIKKRQSNYEQLLLALVDLGLSPANNLEKGDCPFAMPIRVNNRDDFREYLMDKRIYCAIHWPFDGVDNKARKLAQKNAKTLISLPIDQRYESEDIQYLTDCILKYGGKLLF